MLIAQTGTGSALPSNAQDSQGNGSLAIFWWLLPLAVAVIWIAWYVRSNKGQSNRARAPKPASSLKTNKGLKSSASSDRTASISTTAESFDSIEPRMAGSSKKKKDKNKSKRNRTNKPTTPAPTESVVKAGLPLKGVGENRVEGSASVVQAAVALPQAMTGPKPSNAIFEPLRPVLKERRKSSIEDNTDSYSSKNDSRHNENDAFNQLFGGKFERTIPKATIRSVANRWPTTAAPQVKTPETLTPKPQPIAKSNNTDTINPILPVAPAPAKGLTSFVSKVKTSTVSDSEPAPKDD